MGCRTVLLGGAAAIGFWLPAGLAGGWRACRSLGDAAPDGAAILVKAERMGPARITLVYAVPAPRLARSPVSVGGVAWERVRVGNAPALGRVGAPLLPVIPVRLILARGYAVERIEVRGEQPIVLPGVHRVEPRQPAVPLVAGAAAKTAPPDPAIYGSSAEYPGGRHTLIGVQRKRGVAFLLLNLHPVSYAPADGRLTGFRRMTVTVTARPEPAGTAPGLPFRPDPVLPLAAGAENPEMLAAGGYAIGEPSPSPLGPLCRAGVTNRYVVVTSAAISNAATDVTVRDLVAHKQARGLSAAIVTIESILAGYSGVDDAEKLRNFIRDAYGLWGTDYLLLGGDVAIVPLRKLWNRCLDEGTTWYEDHIPSDLYFQCLDGDYNANGNDKWGEETDGPGGTDVDLLAEVYIGRASADNETEMSHFVFKTLAHASEPDDAPHLRAVLMAGESLGNYPMRYGDTMLEELVWGCGLWGYTTLGFAENPLIARGALYDGLPCVPPESQPWPAAAMIARLNSGGYGLVNHNGHASDAYGLRLTNGQVDALTNGPTCFIYSQGCYSGNIEADCIAEHLTTSTRHGAYAAVFNARYGFFYSQNTDGPSQHFHRAFWDALFRHGIQELGALNAKSHEDTLWALPETEIRWCLYETNLLGDPETRLRVPALVGPATAADVGAHTAVLGGAVVLTNGGPATERGVFWGTNSGALRATGVRVFETGVFGTGAFAFAVAGLPAATPLTVLAYAVNALGTNAGPETAFLTRPEAPAVLPPTNGTLDTFDAAWEDVAGASAYRLDVASAASFADCLSGFSNRNAGAVLSLTVTGLQARTPYWYRVRAENAAGSGPDSAAQSVPAAAVVVADGPWRFSGTYGGPDPAPQAIPFANTGARGASFRAVPAYSAGAAGWFALSPATGLLAGRGAAAMTGRVSLVGVPAGVYWVTNTVLAPEASNSPVVFVARLSVARAAQTMTVFAPPDGAVFADTARVPLAAQASSGLPVSFAVVGGPGRLAAGPRLVFTGTGRVMIAASQPGDANYLAAPTIRRSYSARGFPPGLAGCPAADFDGDGVTDPAVYEAATGSWTVRLSSAGYAPFVFAGLLGGPGWVPAAADYDGDRLGDPAAYLAASGAWRFRLSGSGYLLLHREAFLGGPGWAPAVADYDGDRRADIAAYREPAAAGTGDWAVRLSDAGYRRLLLPEFLGAAGDAAASADYDGDGLADPAVYRRADGTWSVCLSSAGYAPLVAPGVLGGPGWDPMPGDYDGDGLADPAVRRVGGASWRFRLSGAGYALIEVPLEL